MERTASLPSAFQAHVGWGWRVCADTSLGDSAYPRAYGPRAHVTGLCRTPPSPLQVKLWANAIASAHAQRA